MVLPKVHPWVFETYLDEIISDIVIERGQIFLPTTVYMLYYIDFCCCEHRFANTEV